MIRTRSILSLLLAGAVALMLVGCSTSDDSADKATTTVEKSTTTAASTEVLKILVSNDDGYSAPGIDAVVRALEALSDTEVMVSAPATQQSGHGSDTTAGDLVATDQKTASGVPAKAVQGTPADSVNWALDGGLDFKPDLVVTGINTGQNLGSIANLVSGTIGAARAAVAHGIPALASSIGLAKDADYDLAATYVVNWVEKNRASLVSGRLAGDDPLLENLNVPYCATGVPRGLVEVTLSGVADHALDAQDCESTVPAPPDDITAFVNGFVTLSSVPPTKPAS